MCATVNNTYKQEKKKGKWYSRNCCLIPSCYTGWGTVHLQGTSSDVYKAQIPVGWSVGIKMKPKVDLSVFLRVQWELSSTLPGRVPLIDIN